MFSKFLPTYSASMKWHYLGGFWALAPPNVVQYCRNSHQRKYASKQKHSLKKNGRIWVLMKKRQNQSLQFWSDFDTCFLLKMAEKIDSSVEKLQSLGYIQIWQNQCSVSSPSSRENALTFCKIWTIFIGKQGRFTNQSVRIKIWKNFVNFQKYLCSNIF